MTVQYSSNTNYNTFWIVREEDLNTIFFSSRIIREKI